jgi:hypothetical protein
LLVELRTIILHSFKFPMKIGPYKWKLIKCLIFFSFLLYVLDYYLFNLE